MSAPSNYRPSIIEAFAIFDYNAGYLAGTGPGFGTARRGDMDGPTYERGLLAGRVAAWCGVDLSMVTP